MSVAVEAKTEALKHYWWIERDKLAIVKVKTDDDTSNWGDPDKDKVVTYFASLKDTQFIAAVASSTSVSPAIPPEFHEAMVQYAIMKGYEINPEMIPSAQYFRSQWERSIAKGKKYGNRGRDGTATVIRQHEY